MKEISGMPLPDEGARLVFRNRLIHEETNFDINQMATTHAQLHAGLNPCQQNAYEAIMHSVTNNLGSTIFVQGHGGTGKTYLWNTIIAKLRSARKIVLPVASSGIAALLLPNGRTAHSRFHIPLEVDTHSTCEIKHGTHLAELLCETSLIIWDEAPMANRFCFEALDRTLRDILRDKSPDAQFKPFGGITVVFGGDFRQILPVIHKGKKSDTINATLNSSYIWDHVSVYHLKTNMRLHSTSAIGSQVNEILEFAEWLLQIGDGSFFNDPENELVNIPSDLQLKPTNDNINSIVDYVYPNIELNYHDPHYLSERAILTPKTKRSEPSTTALWTESQGMWCNI